LPSKINVDGNKKRLLLAIINNKENPLAF